MKVIDNMNIEINEKNQTINFLLSQLEELKNNINVKCFLLNLLSILIKDVLQYRETKNYSS